MNDNHAALALSSTIEEADMNGYNVILRYSFARREMYVWFPQVRQRVRGEVIFVNHCIPLRHALELGYNIMRNRP
jgi:hypothetical protein